MTIVILFVKIKFFIHKLKEKIGTSTLLNIIRYNNSYFIYFRVGFSQNLFKENTSGTLKKLFKKTRIRNDEHTRNNWSIYGKLSACTTTKLKFNT